MTSIQLPHQILLSWQNTQKYNPKKPLLFFFKVLLFLLMTSSCSSNISPTLECVKFSTVKLPTSYTHAHENFPGLFSCSILCFNRWLFYFALVRTYYYRILQ